MTWRVKETSLLGKALAKIEGVDAVAPQYRSQLQKVADWGDAENNFDRLAEKIEPTMRDEFASQLLSLVMSSALDAATVAPSNRTSTISKRRADIESRYAELFSSLDILDRAFRAHELIIELTPTGEALEETLITLPGAFSSDNDFLHSAVEAWRVALDPVDTTPDDEARKIFISYQNREFSAALIRMRAFLIDRKAAGLGAIDIGTISRKPGGNAHMRTFIVLLSRKMKEAFGFHDVSFLTTMANCLFRGDGVEFHEENVTKMLERATKRRARA